MMRRLMLFAVLAVFGSCKSHSESVPPAPTGPPTGNEDLTVAQVTAGLKGEGPLMAEIGTRLGKLHCTLHPEAAPQGVASFVGLARGMKPWVDPATGKWVRKPFYDGLTFYRVIPEFMIMGGDPLSRSKDKEAHVGRGGPGYKLPDEISSKLKFDHPGVLALDNDGPHTHTGGSRFLITEVPYPKLNGRYSILGDCQEIDVIKKIARVPKRQGTPVPPISITVKIYHP